MKKTAALVCAFAMVLTMAACAKQAAPGESSAPASVESQPSVSSPAGGSASSTVSSAATVVTSAPAADVKPNPPARAVSAKVQSNKNSGDYQVKNTDYKYNKDNMDYKATYPQLSGKVTSLQKVNDALKSSAMKTINSLGTAKKAQKTTLKVSGDVAFEGKNFISVGFNEYTTLSPKADTTHTFRTVNLNLKTGASVGLPDMIVKSDAFYAALEKAAKAQLDSKTAAAVNESVIKSGLDANAIYFTDTSVGFSIQVTKPEKKLIRITLGFDEAKPFMTKNENWSNFI